MSGVCMLFRWLHRHVPVLRSERLSIKAVHICSPSELSRTLVLAGLYTSLPSQNSTAMLFKKTASKKTQLDGWASRLDIEQGARKHQEQKEIDNGGVALAATVTEEVPPALSFQPVMDWTSAIGRQLYNSVAPASSASKEITEEANVVASNDVRTMTTKWTDSAPR